MDVLGHESIKAMFEHGTAEYPNECCGIVFANGAVHRATNIQQRLHEQCPDVYTRSADTGYAFSVSDIKLLSSRFASPNPSVAT